MRTRTTAAILSLLTVAPTLAQEEVARASRGSILERYGGAIVRIEAVLETKFNLGGQGDERDSRLDLGGAIVDPSGLVMAWNSQISAARIGELMRILGGSPGFSVEIKPVDFKVYLKDPRREVQAFLAATDSNLDLAFLQLEELPDTPLTTIDFSRSVEPDVGDEIVAIARLGRKFDDAPFLQTARIGGHLRKPRRAMIVDGRLASYGLPVFTPEGEPVGALTTIVSHVGDDAGRGPYSLGQMMANLIGPTAGAGPLGTFILPGARVQAVIELAKERSRELQEQRRESSTE